MSLADELLADLEENDDAELESMIDNKTSNNASHEFAVPYPVIPKEDEIKNVSIRELAKLRYSERLQRVVTEIEQNHGNNRKKIEVTGLMESDPEYQLIVEANNIAAEIDGEIAIIHRFVRDKYQKRFPELESLIITPLEYIRTVKELGNDLDRAKNNEILQSFLTQATIMIVSVTASTTQGKLLMDNELMEINEACEMAGDLNHYKSKIYEYVESRMTFIAPNITAIVGASTAAKILGVAGGLSKLSKMPACNVLPLGQQKKTLSGFSQAAALPHTGFIYFSQIVQDTTPELRYKAAKLVSTKLTLAARVDACHESTDGHIGRMLREGIEKKLDKLQEPPPVKFVKPLPKPIEQSRKKRGGKRVRKMKERYAMTEFRKNANRLNFADLSFLRGSPADELGEFKGAGWVIEDDAYQEDLGYTRGTIGKSSTGRVRLPQIDEKTKVRISKTLQKNLQKQNQQYGGATSIRRQVSGTASSVAFTPLQGLEIVNPQAAETRVNEANAKYFSNTSGFLSVGKKTT
ncbi:U4/U6 small nuclear ribonucleoprotein Prp31 [Papilio machaon]|uniref:U4/U6 small nuclear ribonucleoprotein Prp31 n=1 Tax=Papilio machaon TaxID=76193 RepID=A0A194QRB4_PAPMA|nr:U4/U6 small nuclear ribonucleoprotein Prp31 [Papilio machaon]